MAVMVGVSAMEMAAATVTRWQQRQRQWKAQWQCDGNGNGRRDGDVMATTAMAMEGTMATAAEVVVMVGALRTAMECATAMQWPGWQWSAQRQW